VNIADQNFPHNTLRVVTHGITGANWIAARTYKPDLAPIRMIHISISMHKFAELYTVFILTYTHWNAYIKRYENYGD